VPALEKATGAAVVTPPTTTGTIATTGTPSTTPTETPTNADNPPIVDATDKPIDATPESTKGGGGLGLQKTLAIVAGGVGLATVGVGLYLRGSGKSQYDDAVARCTLPGPNPCSPADADDAT